MSFAKNGGPGGSLRRPLESFIDKTKTCWAWIGATKNSRGIIYGAYRVPDGRLRSAHTVVYEYLKGPIPKGLEPNHICRNTICVRPEHLELVTHKENVLRGISPSAVHARQTHAPCGHPYDAKDPIRRYCKSCRTKWHREYYRRNKDLILSRQKGYRKKA